MGEPLGPHLEVERAAIPEEEAGREEAMHLEDTAAEAARLTAEAESTAPDGTATSLDVPPGQ